MSIRKLLTTPVEDRTVLVEHEGETYTVTGRPDAALLTRCQAIPEAQLITKTRHLTTLVGREIDVNSYRNILFVLNTLQPDPDEKPYQEHELASISVNHGILFSKLLSAAMDVLGLLAEANLDGASDPIAEQAVKN